MPHTCTEVKQSDIFTLFDTQVLTNEANKINIGLETSLIQRRMHACPAAYLHPLCICADRHQPDLLNRSSNMHFKMIGQKKNVLEVTLRRPTNSAVIQPCTGQGR